MCRSYDLATQTQGHSSGLFGFTHEFHICSLSPLPLERYSLKVHPSGMMCRSYDLATQTQGQSSGSFGFTIECHVCSLSPLPLERYSLKFGQMFTSVK